MGRGKVNREDIPLAEAKYLRRGVVKAPMD